MWNRAWSLAFSVRWPIRIEWNFPHRRPQNIHRSTTTAFDNQAQEKWSDGKSREEWSTRYASTYNLLIAYIDEKGNASTSWYHAALDFWSSRLSSFTVLKGLFEHPTYRPRRGGLYILTREDWAEQCSHKDFLSSINTASYFVMITHPGGAPLYVCTDTHLYVLCTGIGGRMLAITMMRKGIIVSPNSAFFGHDYMQYAGLAWRRTHGVQNNI